MTAIRSAFPFRTSTAPYGISTHVPFPSHYSTSPQYQNPPKNQMENNSPVRDCTRIPSPSENLPFIPNSIARSSSILLTSSCQSPAAVSLNEAWRPAPTRKFHRLGNPAMRLEFARGVGLACYSPLPYSSSILPCPQNPVQIIKSFQGSSIKICLFEQ
jgi:hypothetical protein